MKSDSDLKKEVLVRLEFDRELDSTGLGVDVTDGVVTIEGELHDQEERVAAERAVKLVPGVKGLVVRCSTEHSKMAAPTDAEIKKSANAALEWLTTVPAENVVVTVCDGWITLNGAVESCHQRELLEDLMRHLPQSKGVNNLLEAKGGTSLETRTELNRAALS